MALGDDIKSMIDDLRDDLGTSCTLNAGTALGKCSFAAVNPAQLREVIGEIYDDEIGLPWAMIEVPAGFSVKEQDKITVGTTSEVFVVRRVTNSMANGVLLAQRCYCIGQML